MCNRHGELGSKYTVACIIFPTLLLTALWSVPALAYDDEYCKSLNGSEQTVSGRVDGDAFKTKGGNQFQQYGITVQSDKCGMVTVYTPEPVSCEDGGGIIASGVFEDESTPVFGGDLFTLTTDHASCTSTAAAPTHAAAAGSPQYLSNDDVAYTAEFNSHGVVLRSPSATIYLGNSCDVASPQYGTGFWNKRSGGGVMLTFISPEARIIGFRTLAVPLPCSTVD